MAVSCLNGCEFDGDVKLDAAVPDGEKAGGDQPGAGPEGVAVAVTEAAAQPLAPQQQIAIAPSPMPPQQNQNAFQAGVPQPGGVVSFGPAGPYAFAAPGAPVMGGPAPVYAPMKNENDNPPCNTLFIGNLSEGVDESELQAVFGYVCFDPARDIVPTLSLRVFVFVCVPLPLPLSVNLIPCVCVCVYRKQNGFQQLKVVKTSKGISAFIEFTDTEAAVACHQSQQGLVLQSSDRGPIRVQFSKNPFGRKNGNQSVAHPMPTYGAYTVQVPPQMVTAGFSRPQMYGGTVFGQ